MGFGGPGHRNDHDDRDEKSILIKEIGDLEAELLSLEPDDPKRGPILNSLKKKRDRLAVLG